MSKLTPTMKRALGKFEGPQHRPCAYELRESISTLRALADRGILKSHNRRGSEFCPATGVRFCLTEKGVETWQNLT